MILKLVNAAAEPCEVEIQLAGARAVKPGATGVLLAGEKPTDENSFDAPTRVSPRPASIQIQSPTFHQILPKYSVTVLRVGL